MVIFMVVRLNRIKAGGDLKFLQTFLFFHMFTSLLIERFSLDCRKGLVLVLVLVLLRPLVG